MPLQQCSICRKPAVEQYRPFCSARCADVDLGRWLGETYRVPLAPQDDEDGDKPENSTPQQAAD